MAEAKPDKKEEKELQKGSAKLEGAKKAMEIAKMRSKKLIANMLIVTIIVTLIGVGMSSIGLGIVFAFLFVGMLPGIVTGILDSRPGRFAAKTVIAFNLSGISPHTAAILASGSPDNTAVSIFTNPTAWLLVYGFAAFGWGVVYLIPHIAQLYLEIKANFTVKKLQYFQERLIDEWGDNVKGR